MMKLDDKSRFLIFFARFQTLALYCGVLFFSVFVLYGFDVPPPGWFPAAGFVWASGLFLRWGQWFRHGCWGLFMGDLFHSLILQRRSLKTELRHVPHFASPLGFLQDRLSGSASFPEGEESLLGSPCVSADDVAGSE